MDKTDKPSKVQILSPDPKRLNIKIQTDSSFEFKKPLIHDTDHIDSISELNQILGISDFSFETNLKPWLLSFSAHFPDREKMNPMIFDEKFIELEYSLSTTEDSGSDSDLMTQIN
jgi:hypothetical protein